MSDATPFDFSAIPTLTTQRLILREPRPSDASDVFVFRSDCQVQMYNGPVHASVAESEALVAEVMAEFAGKTGVPWAVEEEGRVIGLFGMHDIDTYHRRAELGYDMSRARWGRGLASEALGAIVQCGFARMGLNRIGICTLVDNVRSVRLAERLGFRREGTRREYVLEDDGTFRDSAVFGMVRGDFESGPPRYE